MMYVDSKAAGSLAPPTPLYGYIVAKVTVLVALSTINCFYTIHNL